MANLKRLWDTENKKTVWAIPTAEPYKKLQVWTNDDGSKLYVYRNSQYIELDTLNATVSEYGHYWKELNDEMVGYYLTPEPTNLYNWDEGDEVSYVFKDWDGTVLKSGKIAEGQTPTAPADPTRAATAQYTYTFAGWNPTVGPISKRTVYTATYTAIALIPVTSISNFSKTNNADMVEFGTTSYTFDYLPANANSFTNIEAILREDTGYSGNVSYSIDYDNGTATVTVTDLGEPDSTTYVTYAIDFKLNNVLIQGVKGDILKTFTATFNVAPISLGSGTIAPNPIDGVPYGTVVTDDGMDVIFTNTKVGFSVTVVATPDEGSVLGQWDSYADSVTENRECDVYWDLAN